MSHDPKARAEAQARIFLAQGISARATVDECAKLGHTVSRSSCGRWLKEIEASTGKSSVEIKTDAVRECYESFVTEFLITGRKQLEFLGDRQTLEKRKTSEVIAHTESLFRMFRILEQMHPPDNQASSLPEICEVEVVEE